MRINIISIQQVPSLLPGRIRKTDTVVTFGIEGEGTDFITIPDPNPDQKSIEAAIRDKLTARNSAQGQSFEV